MVRLVERLVGVLRQVELVPAYHRRRVTLAAQQVPLALLLLEAQPRVPVTVALSRVVTRVVVHLVLLLSRRIDREPRRRLLEVIVTELDLLGYRRVLHLDRRDQRLLRHPPAL